MDVDNIDNLSTWSSNRTIVMMASYEGTSSNTLLHWGASNSGYRDEQFEVTSSTKVSLVDGHSSGDPSVTAESTDDVSNGMCLIYQTDHGVNIDRTLRSNGEHF